MSEHQLHRELLLPLRQSMVDFEQIKVKNALASLFSSDAIFQLSYPFETFESVEQYYDDAYQSLYSAFPDLERRDTIVIAGTADNETHWVGCAGYYTGTFLQPWLNIPATGHQASLRFHEFYRFESGQAVELQAIWDIPELMMQANAWPMAPGLGREWHVPGPATQDGIITSASPAPVTEKSVQLVKHMLEALGKYASGGVEAMRLEEYWHPAFSWYGPSGIGTSRGIQGFRDNHQIPFLNGMPDRVGAHEKGNLFGEGHYAGFTAWPGMHMTLSGNGFLGIAPSNQQLTMRSLDFWRREGDLLRENWVLVDLLDVYNQLGVDVLGRMAEFNKAASRVHTARTANPL